MAMALIGALGPSPLADDLPGGTDLALRVPTRLLARDGVALWEDLRPLVEAWPGLSHRLEDNRQGLAKTVAALRDAAGVDFEREGATLTLTVDLDAAGGLVAAAVLRGALAAGDAVRQSAEGDTIVEGHVVKQLADTSLRWARLDGGDLIVGNERGVQRQIRRQLGVQPPATTEISHFARRLRDPGSLKAVLHLPARARRKLSETAGPMASFVERLRAATLLVNADQALLHLVAERKNDQQALQHAVRGVVGLLRGAASLLEGGTELLIGLNMLGNRPPALPFQLRVRDLEPLVREGRVPLELKAKIRARKPYDTEVKLEVSSYPTLVVAGLMLWAALLPEGGDPLRARAQALLLALREAQRRYRTVHGEYLECGPVPNKVPMAPIPWPKAACFERLHFEPDSPTPFQLQAQTEEGKLVLLARVDPDGDGIPLVWYLDEDSEQIRDPGGGEPPSQERP